MSQENVEIVRAAFEAWNAGDMDAVPEVQTFLRKDRDLSGQPWTSERDPKRGSRGDVRDR